MFNDQEFSFHRPFGTWVIENIFFKLVPAEGHAISAIEAVLKINRTMAEENLDPSRDIAIVRVRTHAGAILIINKSGELHNAADRDHCMQYMMAVTFLKGALIEYADYGDTSPWASDPRVAELRAKMELVEEERYSKEYLDVDKRSAATGVTVVLKSGRELEEVSIEYPLGHALRTETVAAVQEKIRKNLRRAFTRQQVEHIIQSVESEDMSVKDFVNLFAKEQDSHPRL
jgi:2-methylcitrate dehydratase